MGYNEQWTTDENGNPKLIKSEPFDDVIIPNWYQLQVDLKSFGNLIQQANPNAFSIFLLYLSNGEKGLSTENSFMSYFNDMGLTLTDVDKTNLNTVLEKNNFTVRF